MAASALRSRCACSRNHHCCANSSVQDLVVSRSTRRRISIMESTGSLIGRCRYPQESNVLFQRFLIECPEVRVYGQPEEVTLAVKVASVFSGVRDFPPVTSCK